jgi:hypothetical protein
VKETLSSLTRCRRALNAHVKDTFLGVYWQVTLLGIAVVGYLGCSFFSSN